MRCDVCGAAVDAGDRYCRHCGRMFPRPQPASAPVPVKHRCTAAALKAIGVAALSLSLLFAVLAQVAPGLIRPAGPKDLGVSWTEEDYASAIRKCGVAFDDPPKGANKGEYIEEFTGSMAVDWTLTESDLTALMNGGSKPGYWPFRQAQVKLHEDSVVEISCLVDAAKIMTWPSVARVLPREVADYAARITAPIPVYMKASVVMTGPKTVDITVQQLSVSGFSLMEMGAGGQVKQMLESIVNAILGEAAAVRVDSLSTTEGTMRLRGAWYRELKRRPAQ